MKKIVKKFNNLIIRTIFKVKNKTNNNYHIGTFNKSLIASISLLFFYIFYLSIPVLYEKNWLQRNIEKKISKEFKIKLNTISDFSYRILPRPHFLIKNSKILKKDGEKNISIADIKNLKVFINQGNLFNKEKITLKSLEINNANFSLLKSDIKLLNNSSKTKFSSKKIEINNSNIFFKDNSDETIAIIKISKILLFLDDKGMSNLFNLKGEVFRIPFNLNFMKQFNSLENEEVNIYAKSLKLDIHNISNKDKDNFTVGKNVISILDSKISSNYKIKDGVMIFGAKNSKIGNSKVNYNGELSIDPFDLNLNIDLGNFKISKLLDTDSILIDLIRTKLLFNDNISIRTSIKAATKTKKEIFKDIKINFDINNGKIDLDKTKLTNKKIGTLELEDSDLFFINKRLNLNTNIIINIIDSDELFSFLQTKKKSKKKIKNILINLDYDFLAKQIKFNNLKIDGREVSDQLLRATDGFNDIDLNNLNRTKRLLNRLLDIYAG